MEILGFGSLLFSLPVLIGQWIGILGLRKTGRNPAWWFTMVGICCSTLGLIVYAIFMGLMASGQSHLLHSSSIEVSIFACRGFSALGSLLFAIGFAVHGLRASRIHQRVTELEAIAAAQSDELDRLRS
ncbi:MAG TPA: hypothetical protein VF258_03450 [Luteolibacter sp.]